jgi:hypothetical protein
MKGFISLGILPVVLLALVESGSSAESLKIQNRDSVQRFYGNPISEVYRTSQNLTVTASFATNGSLCTANLASMEDGITDSELNAVLDELAPEEVRGKHKLSTFLNMTCLKRLKPENLKTGPEGKPTINLEVDPCAQCSGVSNDYERATITIFGNKNEYSSARIIFKRAECKNVDRHP